MHTETPRNDPAAEGFRAAECDNFWADAPIISRYTVEQGVEDGLLFDGRNLDGEAGKIIRDQFKGQPCYLTAALHALIQKAVDHPRWCNDWAGVVWDIVWMARRAVITAARQAEEAGTGRASFLVIITGTGRRRNHVLDAVLNGDGLTFCLQGED